MLPSSVLFVKGQISADLNIIPHQRYVLSFVVNPYSELAMISVFRVPDGGFGLDSARACSDHAGEHGQGGGRRSDTTLKMHREEREREREKAVF